jgi:hypothetical protein
VQLRKLNASDGSPVAAFGSAGVLEGPAAAAGDGIPLVWTAALDDAALYLAGPEALSATQSRWRVEKRDKTSGGLVGGFGSSGVVVAAAHGLIDACFALVLDGSSMWIAGTQDADAGVSSNSKIRIEKRSLSTGALVPGFGTGGLLTIDAGPGDDLAEDAVRDGSFLYVYSRVETGFGTGIFSARLDKLSLADGASAATLSGLGGLDPTGELPCRHLALDGGDLFVAGADQSGDPRWRLEKRRASDLSVNTAFAGSGVLLLNPSGGDDRPLDLLVRGGVVYVVGTDASAGGGRWRIEARWK